MFSPANHAAYLREKAVRFRELAAAVRGSLSRALLALAAEMEATASAIENTPAPPMGTRPNFKEPMGHPAYAADERRLIYRVLRHWTEMAIAQRYPRIDNIDPWLVGDDWANCMILKLSPDKERSAFIVVGENLSLQGLSLDGASVGESPRKTVLADLLKHVESCAADGAPVIIDGSAEHQGAIAKYRGILLPLSSDGQAVDGIFGAANFKKLVSQ